jgi:hypothetical protein
MSRLTKVQAYNLLGNINEVLTWLQEEYDDKVFINMDQFEAILKKSNVVIDDHYDRC